MLFRSLNMVIIERMLNGYVSFDSNGKRILPNKSDVRAGIVKFGDNWRYEHVVDFSAQLPDTLDEYHRRVHEFYSNRHLSDEELDSRIY